MAARSAARRVVPRVLLSRRLHGVSSAHRHFRLVRPRRRPGLLGRLRTRIAVSRRPALSRVAHRRCLGSCGVAAVRLGSKLSRVGDCCRCRETRRLHGRCLLAGDGGADRRSRCSCSRSPSSHAHAASGRATAVALWLSGPFGAWRLSLPPRREPAALFAPRRSIFGGRHARRGGSSTRLWSPRAITSRPTTSRRIRAASWRGARRRRTSGCSSWPDSVRSTWATSPSLASWSARLRHSRRWRASSASAGTSTTGTTSARSSRCAPPTSRRSTPATSPATCWCCASGFSRRASRRSWARSSSREPATRSGSRSKTSSPTRSCSALRRPCRRARESLDALERALALAETPRDLGAWAALLGGLASLAREAARASRS